MRILTITICRNLLPFQARFPGLVMVLLVLKHVDILLLHSLPNIPESRDLFKQILIQPANAGQEGIAFHTFL